jgi:DNA-binding transcriptional ArsR family regulator
MTKAVLSPTVWRTCRVLGNARRLRILATILPSRGMPVAHLADLCGLTEDKASLHLRSLQSRGLLSVIRSGRWTIYSPIPDPLVEHAKPFLDILRAAFDRRDRQEDMRRELLACSHPRRVVLIAALAALPAGTESLVTRCGISRPALYRHLNRLRSAGIAVCGDGKEAESNEKTDGVWRIHPRLTPLARDLVAQIHPGTNQRTT